VWRTDLGCSGCKGGLSGEDLVGSTDVPDCMDLQAAVPTGHCWLPLFPSLLARSYQRYCGTPAEEPSVPVKTSPALMMVLLVAVWLALLARR